MRVEGCLGNLSLFFFFQATGLYALPGSSDPPGGTLAGSGACLADLSPPPGHHFTGSTVPRSFPALSPPPPSALLLTRFPLPDQCTLTPLSSPATPHFPISSRGAIVSSVLRFGALNPLVPDSFSYWAELTAGGC